MKPFLIIALFLICLNAGAATYYVTKAGNDTTGDGSVGTPWLTITKAAATVASGDTNSVLLGAGTNLTTWVTDDYLGDARTAPFTIGMFENAADAGEEEGGGAGVTQSAIIGSGVRIIGGKR